MAHIGASMLEFSWHCDTHRSPGPKSKPQRVIIKGCVSIKKSDPKQICFPGPPSSPGPRPLLLMVPGGLLHPRSFLLCPVFLLLSIPVAHLVLCNEKVFCFFAYVWSTVCCCYVLVGLPFSRSNIFFLEEEHRERFVCGLQSFPFELLLWHFVQVMCAANILHLKVLHSCISESCFFRIAIFDSALLLLHCVSLILHYFSCISKSSVLGLSCSWPWTFVCSGTREMQNTNRPLANGKTEKHSPGLRAVAAALLQLLSLELFGSVTLPWAPEPTFKSKRFAAILCYPLLEYSTASQLPLQSMCGSPSIAWKTTVASSTCQWNDRRARILNADE